MEPVIGSTVTLGLVIVILLFSTKRAFQSMIGRHRDPVTLAAVTVLLLFVPLFIPSFHVFLLSRVFIYTVFALGVSLLWGYAGILSFGQALFFGMGGYVYALVLLHFPNPWKCLLSVSTIPILPSLFCSTSWILSLSRESWRAFLCNNHACFVPDRHSSSDKLV